MKPKQLNLKNPQASFDITENFVNVIIPFNREFSEHHTETDIALNEAQLKVYNYLKDHPKSTLKVIVPECGISDGYVRKIITFLKNNGYVRREGSNKNGKWLVLK